MICTVACMGEKRGVYRVLVEQPKRKGPLGRPSCRWEENIKMALQEIGWGFGVDWIVLAQVRDKWWTLLNSVVNVGVPYNSGNSWTTAILLPCHEGLFSIDVDSCKTFLESALQTHWTKSN